MERVSRYKVVFIIVAAALCCLRFVALDQDAPPYVIAGICQEDEPYYAMSAVSAYNEDVHRNIEGLSQQNITLGFTLYSYPLTYLSLKLLGPTYWGLRIPVVLLSILTIILIADALRRMRVRGWIIACAVLYLCTDFTFFVFSRFQTPQIYSVTAVSVILWTYTRYYGSRWLPVLLGLFCFCAISFVYVYNVFIVLAGGMVILDRAIRKRSFIPLAGFTGGVMIGAAAYLATIWLLGGSLSDFASVFGSHSGGVASDGDTAGAGMWRLKAILARLVQLPATNLFRYDLAMLVLFFVMLPFVVTKGFSRASSAENHAGEERFRWYFYIIAAVLIQSFFVASNSFKKWIVVLPLVCLIIAELPSALAHYASLTGRRKALLVLWLAFCVLLALYNFKVNSSEMYWSAVEYGKYTNTPRYFNVINLLLMSVAALYVLLCVFRILNRHRVLLLLPSVTGVLLIGQFCFIDSVFYSRDGFTRAAAILDGKGVIMAAAYSAEFYTLARPGLGCYADKMYYKDKYDDVAEELFRSGKADFTIAIRFHEDDTAAIRGNYRRRMVIGLRDYSYDILQYVRDQTAVKEQTTANP
jgi:hypothetical protein